MASGGKGLVLGIVMICLLLTGHRPASALFFSKGAVLEPGDSMVFVGETLRMTCKPTNAGTIDLSSVKFKFRALGNEWFLPSANITVMDNVGVEGLIQVTDNFSADTNVACMNGDTSLRSKKIYAEKPLIDVSNLSGYFFDNGPGSSYIQLYWSSNTDYYLRPFYIATKVFYANNAIPTDWSEADISTEEESIRVNYEGQHTIYFNFEVSHKRANKRPDTEYLQPLHNTTTQFVYRFKLSEHREA